MTTLLAFLLAAVPAFAQQPPSGPCLENPVLDSLMLKLELKAERPGDKGMVLVFDRPSCHMTSYRTDAPGRSLRGAARVYEGPTGYHLIVENVEGAKIARVDLYQRFELAPGVPSQKHAFAVQIVILDDLPAKTILAGRASIPDARTGDVISGAAFLSAH